MTVDDVLFISIMMIYLGSSQAKRLECAPFQHANTARGECENCSVLCAKDARRSQQRICKEDSHCQDYLTATSTAVMVTSTAAMVTSTAVMVTSTAGMVTPTDTVSTTGDTILKTLLPLSSSRGPTTVPTTSQTGPLPPWVLPVAIPSAIVVVIIGIFIAVKKYRNRCRCGNRHHGRMPGDPPDNGAEMVKYPTQETLGPGEDSGMFDSRAMLPQEADRGSSASEDEDEMTPKMLARPYCLV